MDREKVVSKLDELRWFADTEIHPIVSPDNWDVYSTLCDLIDQAEADVLALLKDQEAKPMIENELGWSCRSCGMTLVGKTASGYPCDLIDLPEDEPIHFCPKCGQAVKWE